MYIYFMVAIHIYISLQISIVEIVDTIGIIHNSKIPFSLLSLSLHMNMDEIPNRLVDILRIDFDKLIKRVWRVNVTQSLFNTR